MTTEQKTTLLRRARLGALLLSMLLLPGGSLLALLPFIRSRVQKLKNTPCANC